MTTFEIANIDGTKNYELRVTGRKTIKLRTFSSYNLALSHLRTAEAALLATGMKLVGPFKNGHSFSVETA